MFLIADARASGFGMQKCKNAIAAVVRMPVNVAIVKAFCVRRCFHMRKAGTGRGPCRGSGGWGGAGRRRRWRGWMVRPRLLLRSSAARFLVLLRSSDAVVHSEAAVFVHSEASLALRAGFPDTVSRLRLLGFSFPRWFGFLFLRGEHRVLIRVHLISIWSDAGFVFVEPSQAGAVADLPATQGTCLNGLGACC